jgi:hypothetical protein
MDHARGRCSENDPLGEIRVFSDNGQVVLLRVRPQLGICRARSKIQRVLYRQCRWQGWNTWQVLVEEEAGHETGSNE